MKNLFEKDAFSSDLSVEAVRMIAMLDCGADGEPHSNWDVAYLMLYLQDNLEVGVKAIFELLDKEFLILNCK